MLYECGSESQSNMKAIRKERPAAAAVSGLYGIRLEGGRGSPEGVQASHAQPSASHAVNYFPFSAFPSISIKINKKPCKVSPMVRAEIQAFSLLAGVKSFQL